MIMYGRVKKYIWNILKGVGVLFYFVFVLNIGVQFQKLYVDFNDNIICIVRESSSVNIIVLWLKKINFIIGVFINIVFIGNDKVLI